MTRIGDAWEGFLRLWQTCLVAYVLVSLCGAAVVLLDQMHPIDLADVRWVVLAAAMTFPVTAAVYVVFNLRTRFDEILDIGLRNHWASVYFPTDDLRTAERKLSRYVRARFREYYNPVELAAMSVIAGAIAFVLGVFVAVPVAPLTGTLLDVGSSNAWHVLAATGFAGAYVGALVLILRRVRTRDVYPSTYFQVMVGLIAGSLAGAVVGALLEWKNALVVVFATGFLCSVRVGFLYELLRDRFAQATGVALPPEIPTDLDTLVRNSEAIESLTNISINTVGELVRAEPIRLYLNMAQQVWIVNGWLDEALLHHYMGSDRAALESAGIRCFTQLLERQERSSLALTGDAGCDRRIRERCAMSWTAASTTRFSPSCRRSCARKFVRSRSGVVAADFELRSAA